MQSFGSRLAAAVRERGPVCAGIDPHPELLASWGLSGDVAGLERCAQTMVEALAGQVAIVKPQSAFFEAFGSAGICVLERVLADASAAGALTLLDVKRGDIGSTLAAYARAYLTEDSPLAADAITVAPYLGFGTLQPAIDLALTGGRGLFVLARTSNPEGGEFQLAVTGSGATVAQSVVNEVAALNAAELNAAELNAAGLTRAGARAAVDPGAAGSTVGQRIGSIGVVVGLTHGRLDLDLSSLAGPVLAPGIGPQGARAEDIRTALGTVSGLVLPTLSRAIMSAGPDPAALRDRATKAAQALAGVLAG